MDGQLLQTFGVNVTYQPLHGAVSPFALRVIVQTAEAAENRFPNSMGALFAKTESFGASRPRQGDQVTVPVGVLGLAPGTYEVNGETADDAAGGVYFAIRWKRT